MDDHDDTLVPRTGRTYGARRMDDEAAEGRASRRFLEAAAGDLAAHMPDPRQVVRVAAAMAEAHDLQAPTGGMAVTRKAACEPPRPIGVVRLENAAESTLISLSMAETTLDPDAAMELAAALVYHACAARAVHDLSRGLPSVAWAEDDRGPPREAPGDAGAAA